MKQYVSKAIALSVLISLTGSTVFADSLLADKKSVDAKTPATVIQSGVKEVVVPSFTNLPLMFRYPLTGNSVKNGDPISVQVNEDVFVNKVLVFKKGQDAILFVDKSKHAGAWGRGGKLDIQTGSVHDVFGNTYTLNVTKHIGADSKPSAIILPIVSLVIFWPLVFMAFRHGEEAVIPAGTMVTGLTTTSQSLSINE